MEYQNLKTQPILYQKTLACYPEIRLPVREGDTESFPYVEGDGESGVDSDGDDERVTGHLFLPHTYRDHFFWWPKKAEFRIHNRTRSAKY